MLRVHLRRVKRGAVSEGTRQGWAELDRELTHDGIADHVLEEDLEDTALSEEKENARAERWWRERIRRLERVRVGESRTVSS